MRERSVLQSDAKRFNLFNYVLFFIWPALGVINSTFNLQSRSSRIIITFFFGLCGYFYPFTFSQNIDVVRHAERFVRIASRPFSDFIERVSDLFVSNNYKPDIFQPLIEFVVSSFTSNYKIYFAVLGLILGYFFMRLIGVMYRDFENKKNWFAFVFIFLVFVLIPPYRIAGFRHYIAMIVFLICIYRSYVQGDKRFNLLVLLTPLIHFGFFAVLPFYYLPMLVKQRYWAYYVIIVIAFLLQDFTPLYLSDVGEDLQGQLGQRISGYSSQQYIEYIGNLKSKRAIYIDNQIRWTAYFFFATLVLMHRRFTVAEVGCRALYISSLCIFALLMLVTNMETTFVRFSLIFILLCCFLYVRLICLDRYRFSFISKVMVVLVVAFNLAIMTRKTIEFTGEQVVYPTLPVSLFIDSDKSILDLIQ